jgi:hypothetical protein
MPRRLWTTPLLGLLRSEDSVPVGRSFQSLTEYLRGHVGFWGTFEGTTDANGFLTVTHNCGFTPQAVFITQRFVTGVTPHDLGPQHLHDYNEETMDIHFLKKSGNDSSNELHSGFYLIMPYTTER